MIRNDQPTHKNVAQICQHQKASCDLKEIKNRTDDVLLARLHSGQHPSLHQYLHQLNPSQDPICPKPCLEDSHCWRCECPAVEAIMQQVFGSHKKGPWGGLPHNLGMWWCTQGRPWSTLMPTSLWLTGKHTHTHTHTHNHLPLNETHLDLMRGLIHQEVSPKCIIEESSTECCSNSHLVNRFPQL